MKYIFDDLGAMTNNYFLFPFFHEYILKKGNKEKWVYLNMCIYQEKKKGTKGT